VRRTRFDEWDCPIARVTDLMGDWWTPLVLRECFYGHRRFDEFVDALGIPRPVLTQRLGRLVDEGLLEKRQYEERPPRSEYRLTDKGRAFWDVLAAMWRWGMDWQWSEDDLPLQLVDRETGAEIVPVVVDATTGEPMDIRKLRLRLRKPTDPARTDAPRDLLRRRLAG
jgi:DNA-binding HxlR family transcriptional regulator